MTEQWPSSVLSRTSFHPQPSRMRCHRLSAFVSFATNSPEFLLSVGTMNISSWLRLDRWLPNTSMERHLYGTVSKSESESFSDGDTIPPGGWRRKCKWLWASLLALLAIAAVISASLHLLARPWMPSWSRVYPNCELTSVMFRYLYLD